MDKPIGYGLCFECDAELCGPYCMKCNPPKAPLWQWLFVMLIGGVIGTCFTILFG